MLVSSTKSSCTGERDLAPAYWELGRASQIARGQLRRGQWGKFLAAYGIHRVRACRARAIFRSHPTSEAVAGSTVEEAYERRVTRQIHGRRAKDRSTSQDDQADPWLPREKSEAGLQAYLNNVKQGAEEFVDLAAFLERDRRAALFHAYRAAWSSCSFSAGCLVPKTDPASATHPARLCGLRGEKG